MKRVAQNFKDMLLAESVKGILKRQWRKKKSYVVKWKQ